MPAACALGIVRGKFIFNFGIAERLRTLRYPIFTGRVVTENGSSSACFLRKCGAGRRAILKKSSFDGRMKAAGTAKDPIYEKDREHTLLFTQKITEKI